jgi:hypothetical protein
MGGFGLVFTKSRRGRIFSCTVILMVSMRRKIGGFDVRSSFRRGRDDVPYSFTRKDLNWG